MSYRFQWKAFVQYRYGHSFVTGNFGRTRYTFIRQWQSYVSSTFQSTSKSQSTISLCSWWSLYVHANVLYVASRCMTLSSNPSINWRTCVPVPVIHQGYCFNRILTILPKLISYNWMRPLISQVNIRAVCAGTINIILILSVTSGYVGIVNNMCPSISRRTSMRWLVHVTSRESTIIVITSTYF